MGSDSKQCQWDGMGEIVEEFQGGFQEYLSSKRDQLIMSSMSIVSAGR